MDFARLKRECKSVLRDPTVEASLGDWINDSLLEICTQFENPALRLHTPATLLTTTSDWLYPLSQVTHAQGYSYLKKVVRVSSAAQQDGFILESDIYAFDDVDPEHTDTGDDVERVAVQGGDLAIYPMASDSLSIWFYRRPLELVADTDSPEEIPEGFHYKVLVPWVVLRAMRLYPEQWDQMVVGDNSKSLIRWNGLLQAGLYGNGAEIGLIQYWAKDNRKPRVRGPALGSNLGGGGFATTRRWW